MRNAEADEQTKRAAAREAELVLLQVETVERLRKRMTVLHFKAAIAGKESPLDRPGARRVVEEQVLDRMFGPRPDSPS